MTTSQAHIEDALRAALNDREKEIYSIKLDARKKRSLRFAEAGGCETCRGRGWVVTWDTMDSMSGCYHDSSGCKEEGCTPESRQRSGLHPRNNKYDNFHNGSTWSPEYTEEQTSRMKSLSQEISQLNCDIQSEIRKWSIEPGKIARVVKQNAGPKSHRIPVGTEGLVIKKFSNDWGTEKVILLDRNGKRWWPTVKTIAVVDPDPDTSHWQRMEEKELKEKGLPVIAIVKRKSSKAALVQFTTGKEMWLPMSQVPAMKNAQTGKSIAFNLPMWLAKNKDLT